MIIDIEYIFVILKWYGIGMVLYVMFIGFLDGIIEETSTIKLRDILMYPVSLVYSVSKITTSILLKLLKLIVDKFM